MFLSDRENALWNTQCAKCVQVFVRRYGRLE